MAGRYGYTAPTNMDAPQGPAQMEEIYAFWDQYLGESAANAAAFPVYTSRPLGHLIVAADTEAVYVRAATAWRMLMKPAVAFTPAWTNLTVGSGSNSGKWSVTNGWAEVEFRTVLGSGFSVGNPPKLALPVTPHASVLVGTHLGMVTLIDSGTGYYRGGALMDSGAVMQCELSGAAFWGGVNSTTPFTWASSDVLAGVLRYPVA